MQFRLLGPLRVWDGTSWSSIRAAQQRLVLSVLLIEAGRLVATDRLIYELWRDEPPRAAAAVVRGYVMRLRRALGHATDGPLVTGDGGYRLDVDGDDLDTVRFERLVAESHGDPEHALRRLSEALALWHGPPFADVPSSPAVAAHTTRLEDARLAAVEKSGALRLDLGRHHEAVGDLQRLVEEHPLREQFWAQLMLALYRCGRRAEALDAYRTIRGTLTAELGLEPGPPLRDLHLAILSDDRSLLPGPPGRRPVTLNCLPADPPAFAGRRGDLDHLGTLIDTPDRPPESLIVLAGPAGIGKTTLAVHWAHRLTDRFPDGQLFVNLRGFDPTGPAMTPADAVQVLLEALDPAAQDLPGNVDSQLIHYRSLLAGRRMLIVLDNARHSAQVRPLLPGTRTCLVVVTSRNRLAGLVATDGARPVRLDVLSDGEARRLLEHRLDPARLAAEPVATTEIIARCGGLPLPLAVVAGRAATHPHFTLRALAEDLRAGLDGFAVGDDTTDVRAVLSWSYRALSADAARLFRLLAVHPGPALSAAAAAGLAGLPQSRARRLLTELTGAHMLDETAPCRYAFHDLLRLYAAELASSVDGQAKRSEALYRLLDHYLHTAHAAARLLGTEHESVGPGTSVEHLAGPPDALAWFARERPALISLIGRAADDGFDRHAGRLAGAMTGFLDLSGHWHDQITVQAVARDAAVRVGDRHAEVRALTGIARAHARLGRYADAHAGFRRAAVLAEPFGDDPLRAQTRADFGAFLVTLGTWRDAVPSFEEALSLYERLGHLAGQARVLGSLGWCHAMLGDYQRAYDHCERGLAVAVKLRDPGQRGSLWDTIGVAHAGLGDHRQAVDCYRRALDLVQGLGHPFVEAQTQTRLGDSQRALGRWSAARTAWQRALDILVNLGHPHADDLRHKLQTAEL